MTKQEFDRRDFLKSAVIGGAAAAGGTAALAPTDCSDTTARDRAGHRRSRGGGI